MRKRLLVLAVLALGLAACGSSKAPGVVQAPSGGLTQAPATTTPKPPPALAKEPVVTVPKSPAPTHLVIKDLITGTGKAAGTGSTVTVNYVGVLYKTGKQFDSSWSRNQPSSFPLTNGGVIRGWLQGIPGMKVGGRRELIVPPNLAYGAAGNPPTIPPNSPLVFVVDLLATT
jgi:peptidylprolyl isomerase